VVASTGDLTQALKLASEADNRDVAVLGLVAGLASAKRFKEAEGVLVRVRDEEERWEGWETLACSLASQGKTLEVMTIADRFPTEHKYRLNDVVLSLVESLAKEGRYLDARRVTVQYWSSDPIARVEAMAVAVAAARRNQLCSSRGDISGRA